MVLVVHITKKSPISRKKKPGESNSARISMAKVLKSTAHEELGSCCAGRQDKSDLFTERKYGRFE